MAVNPIDSTNPTDRANPLSILAVMAHPDDAEISAWGSLCAWHQGGAQVHVLVCTRGEGGRGGEGGALQGQPLAQVRIKEAMQASQIQGFLLDFLEYVDGALHPQAALAGVTLTQAIAQHITRIKPSLLLTHAPLDYHSDHRAVFCAATAAASFKVPLLQCDTMAGTGFEPTCYVDISAHMPAKEQAILCHQTQEPERFVQASRLQNAFRARQCNAPHGSFAEAFRFEPSFPFSDIRALLPAAPALRRL